MASVLFSLTLYNSECTTTLATSTSTIRLEPDSPRKLSISEPGYENLIDHPLVICSSRPDLNLEEGEAGLLTFSWCLAPGRADRADPRPHTCNYAVTDSEATSGDELLRQGDES